MFDCVWLCPLVINAVSSQPPDSVWQCETVFEILFDFLWLSMAVLDCPWLSWVPLIFIQRRIASMWRPVWRYVWKSVFDCPWDSLIVLINHPKLCMKVCLKVCLMIFLKVRLKVCLKVCLKVWNRVFEALLEGMFEGLSEGLSLTVFYRPPIRTPNPGASASGHIVLLTYC